MDNLELNSIIPKELFEQKITEELKILFKKRIITLSKSIINFIETEREIPIEWFQEYNELINKIN